MHFYTKQLAVNNKQRNVPYLCFNAIEDKVLFKTLIGYARDKYNSLNINSKDNESEKITVYSIFSNLLAKASWAAYFEERTGLSINDIFEPESNEFLIDTINCKVHASNVRNGIDFAFNNKYGFDVLGPTKTEFDNGDTKDVYLQSVIVGDVLEWGDSIVHSTPTSPLRVYLAGCMPFKSFLLPNVSNKVLQDLNTLSSSQYKTIPLCYSYTPDDLINALLPNQIYNQSYTR